MSERTSRFAGLKTMTRRPIAEEPETPPVEETRADAPVATPIVSEAAAPAAPAASAPMTRTDGAGKEGVGESSEAIAPAAPSPDTASSIPPVSAAEEPAASVTAQPAASVAPAASSAPPVAAPTPAPIAPPARRRGGRSVTPTPAASGVGKRSDPDYTQISGYVKKDTYRKVRVQIVQSDHDIDLSDVLEGLFAGWVSGRFKL